jgi:hypothetical protein
MRAILIISGCMLLSLAVKAQKWQPGYFYDVKGTKNSGLIRQNPPGRSPMKGEGFIEYKENEKAPTIKLSASDLRSYIVGRDSFIVAVAPRTGWSRYELDFVEVAVDAPLRLFIAKGSSGGGFAIQPEVGVGVGASTGGYGSGFGGGVGGGITIPIGGGGRGSSKTMYFYGANTAEMKLLTNENFVDVMSEVMGDEPDVVDRIRNNEFNLRGIDKLLAYFNKVSGSY